MERFRREAPPEEEECELEAAEALAGLTVHGGALKRQSVIHSQDELIAAQKFSDNAATRITSPEKTQKIVDNIPNQLCNGNCQLKSVTKSRPKLTEVEKQARKIRRILANREAARQTIRRRQAMYLDLTTKAADVLEENDNLKKEKKLAVEQFNSLKYRNKFLRAQLAKIKKGEPGDEPKPSEPEKSCPSTTTSPPMFFHNQPSIAPCFWPSIFPSPDVLQSQYTSRSNNSSQSQGQENCTRSGIPGPPLYVYPLPWLLPFVPPSSTFCSDYGAKDTRPRCNTCSCSCSDTVMQEANYEESENQNTTSIDDSKCSFIVPGLFTRVRPQDSPGPARSSSVGEDTSSEFDFVCSRERMRRGLLQKNKEAIVSSRIQTEDIFVASEARKRRKHLMKMRNVQTHD